MDNDIILDELYLPPTATTIDLHARASLCQMSNRSSSFGENYCFNSEEEED